MQPTRQNFRSSKALSRNRISIQVDLLVYVIVTLLLVNSRDIVYVILIPNNVGAEAIMNERMNQLACRAMLVKAFELTYTESSVLLAKISPSSAMEENGKKLCAGYKDAGTQIHTMLSGVLGVKFSFWKASPSGSAEVERLVKKIQNLQLDFETKVIVILEKASTTSEGLARKRLVSAAQLALKTIINDSSENATAAASEFSRVDNKVVTTLTRKPRVFIGGVVEDVSYADAIKRNLSKDFRVTTWRKLFMAGPTSIETLDNKLGDFDYAIFLWTPIDEVRLRGKNYLCPRDNVVFEAGLFAGKKSRFVTYILCPRKFKKGKSQLDIRFPSDFHGVTLLPEFDYDKDGNSTDTVVPACHAFRRAVRDNRKTLLQHSKT